MAVEQPHTYERGGVGDICRYVSPLAVPEHGNAVVRKGYLAAVSQGRPANAPVGQSHSVAKAGVTVRNPVKPVSITAVISLVCPA